MNLCIKLFAIFARDLIFLDEKAPSLRPSSFIFQTNVAPSRAALEIDFQVLKVYPQ